ncbi:putative amino-acid permease P7G5.06 [Exophiala dermatitidis]
MAHLDDEKHVAPDEGSPGPHEIGRDIDPEKLNDPKMQKLAGEITYADEMDPHNPLAQKLRSRHMQMIAIGGSIGAGLFVGSGGALRTGGPGSVLLGFMIVGFMLLCTMQALGELTVLFPVNGAFYTYIVRFVDPALGFAVGWDYAIGWLTVLPFELTAASITIQFWRTDIHVSVWITVFLVFLCIVQVFGVRGYGEVEFVLAMIKIIACVGFIIFGIVVDCGGVPTDHRGYIGAHYWHDPGAFQNGFKGFCTVFVTAAFAFGGTELVGLAAAEAEDPHRSLPKATRQVFWRIATFYVLSLFIVGLIVPSNSPDLLGASGANTKASPFVLAIKYAGVKGLPSVFNAVITISVISVANSCTYGSSRTMQALAARGMGPKFFMYVDKKGRPVWCIVVQLLFGCLAYIGEAHASGTIFTWLLALSGLSFFFLWFSINLSHIRFRHGWYAHGFTKHQLPYQAAFGIVGSYLGVFLNGIAIIATFYTSLFPLGSSPTAKVFFENFLAGPVVIALYIFWKIYSRQWKLFVRASEMDVTTGVRRGSLEIAAERGRSGWKKALRVFI